MLIGLFNLIRRNNEQQIKLLSKIVKTDNYIYSHGNYIYSQIITAKIKQMFLII